MLGAVVLITLAAYSSAQSYGCSPSSYCTSQGYDRVDLLGCQYFCYLDTQAPANSLTNAEFQAAFDSWRGTAPVCDQACYVNAHRDILPTACESEIVGGYNILASQDGDISSVSSADVDSWFQQILSLEPSGDTITPDTFQTYWQALYLQIGDPSCTPL